MRSTPSGSASFASLFPNNELYKTKWRQLYIYFHASRATVVLIIQYQDNMI
jgi:hypothetical protein